MEKNKMQWLIDRFNDGKMECIISRKGEKKGSVVIPTGGGKSGVVYEDIINHILNMDSDEKILFNLSAPILDLEAQFINDLFDCLKVVFADKVKNGEFMFFINSTADGDAYRSDLMYSDVNRFSNIDIFKESKEAKIAFVASCHKSLGKFSDVIDYLNSFTKVICYLDESHLLINEKRDDEKEGTLTEEESTKKDYLVNIFNKSDYVYTLTATENSYINHLINVASGNEDGHTIINISAQSLIKKNIILPVYVYTQKTTSLKSSDKINVGMCLEFMDFVKKTNPSINHKVLISCHNTSHLTKLEKELSEFGYKVFSTCSKEGTKVSDEDALFDTIDKVKFIKEIDNYDGDCFVLHIKRLRQGIDIKSLTDCILYNATRVNDGVKKTLIQTIGRSIRPKDGERGVSIEERLKKVGNVLLVIGEDDFETVERQMVNALVGYYGREGCKIFSGGEERVGTGTGIYAKIGGSWDTLFDEERELVTICINNLKTNIREYIDVKLKETYKFIVLFREDKDTYTFEDFVKSRFGELKREILKYDKNVELGELISDSELMDYMNIVLKDCAE